MLWVEVLPRDIMRVLGVQPWYEGAGHSHGDPGSSFCFSSSSASGLCVLTVSRAGRPPAAGGGAQRGERGGGPSVLTARAEASRPGEQRLTGLSAPEQMQSCHLGARRRLTTASLPDAGLKEGLAWEAGEQNLTDH